MAIKTDPATFKRRAIVVHVQDRVLGVGIILGFAALIIGGGAIIYKTTGPKRRAQRIAQGAKVKVHRPRRYLKPKPRRRFA